MLLLLLLLLLLLVLDQGVLYGIFPAVLFGAALVWLRMRLVRRLSAVLQKAMTERKQVAIAASSGADEKARAAGASVVTLMGDLKSVYRFKDARQVSILCRDMRRWDEDGIPDPDATEFGEFVLKVGMYGANRGSRVHDMMVEFVNTAGGGVDIGDWEATGWNE